jgi:hypothetical protein
MVGGNRHMGTETVANLRKQGHDSLNQFLLEYLNEWRRNSLRIELTVEVMILDLYLLLDPSKVLGQVQLLCDFSMDPHILEHIDSLLATTDHIYAWSMITSRRGDVKKTIQLRHQLLMTQPSNEWVSLDDLIALMMSDSVDITEYISIIQWIWTMNNSGALTIIHFHLPQYNKSILSCFDLEIHLGYLEEVISRWIPLPEANRPEEWERLVQKLFEGYFLVIQSSPCVPKYQKESRISFHSFPTFLSQLNPSNKTISPTALRLKLHELIQWFQTSMSLISFFKSEIPDETEYSYEHALLELILKNPTNAIQKLVHELHDFASAFQILDSCNLEFNDLVQEFMKMKTDRYVFVIIFGVLNSRSRSLGNIFT